MPELLLELLSEEIPARMQHRAASELKLLIENALAQANLRFGSVSTFVTPRRLTVVVKELSERQMDVRIERKGPRSDAPEKAINGFLKSVGLSRSDIEERESEKGLILFAITEQKGRATPEVLMQILPGVIKQLSWPKSMRWGSNSFRWVRPLKSILCLFDGVGIAFELNGIHAGVKSQGHRFLSKSCFSVQNFSEYTKKLRKEYVILDSFERRSLIHQGSKKLAERKDLVVIKDEALLNEVAGLVEWPVPLMGNIDSRFMDLPPEVMMTTMKLNQRYFALKDSEGILAPYFIVVANIETEDGGKAIIEGNERVLRARLSDAKFYWDQDRQRSLESRLTALERIIFHAKLGNLDQKVKRIESLAVDLAEFIPLSNLDHIRSASRLAKADLVTGIVGEFPELQGVMGGYYAANDGEHVDVAKAISEHYSPQGPQDDCPSEPTSIAVALADKIDTLVGFFAINEKPTGSKDPFALRRATLGIIRLILQNKLRIGLRDIFRKSLVLFSINNFQIGKVELIIDDLIEFVAERLKFFIRGQGILQDRITAVFALTHEDDLTRLVARVEALDQFLVGEDGENLLVACRRAENIVRIEEKNDGIEYRGRADDNLLREKQEHDLLRVLLSSEVEIRELLDAEKYRDAMMVLSRLRVPIDTFFTEVTVNCDDLPVRRNRLLLLSQISSALSSVADFSKIEG